jgi:hypothetical protein
MSYFPTRLCCFGRTAKKATAIVNVSRAIPPHSYHFVIAVWRLKVAHAVQEGRRFGTEASPSKLAISKSGEIQHITSDQVGRSGNTKAKIW